MIPYGKHDIAQQDIEAVVNVLENEFLTQGTQVPAFETALAAYCQAEYAVAVNSGTSALHIACMALDVGPGDWVWTSPNSFVASANCALYCQADIDFVDIDPATRNLCPEALGEKLRQARINGTVPKALIVVHFAGLSCDMQKIKALADEYKVAIIEDASHALGGSYQGKPIGCCEFSDMAVMSFHPVKSITSAEGGAVLTNSKALHQRLMLHARHGVTRDEGLMDGESHGPWYYQQIDLGYNYRLSDLHAALGISQLSRVDAFIRQRRQLAARYHHLLKALPLTLPPESEECAWHLFTVCLTGQARSTVYNQLREAGIVANVHYIPIHLQPYFRQKGFETGDFPNAEHYYKNTLSLPLFPTLTFDEQDYVVSVLKQVLAQ